MCISESLALEAPISFMDSRPRAADLDEDTSKIKAAKAAVLSHDRFATATELDPDLKSAVEWIAVRDPAQAMFFRHRCALCRLVHVLAWQAAREREAIVRAIEDMGARFRCDGTTAKWLENADKEIAQVAVCTTASCIHLSSVTTGFKGHQWSVAHCPRHDHWLSRASKRSGVEHHWSEAHSFYMVFHVSCDCLQVGKLSFAGNGKRIEMISDMSEEQLRQNWADTNAKMLERCKEDSHADKLLQACQDDWQKHRMTEPKLLEMSDLVRGSFSPRFSVEQGEHILLGVVIMHNAACHCY